MVGRPRKLEPRTKLTGTISEEAMRRLRFAGSQHLKRESEVLELLIRAHIPPTSADGAGLVVPWELPSEWQGMAESSGQLNSAKDEDRHSSSRPGGASIDPGEKAGHSSNEKRAPTKPAKSSGDEESSLDRRWPPDRLMRALKKANLTQSELARMLHVQAKTVNCWIKRNKGVSKQYEDAVGQALAAFE